MKKRKNVFKINLNELILLIFFQQLRHIELSITTVIMAIIASTLILFLYCFFGKIASESSMGIANLLFQANWQALPLKLQKYFIIMIANAQIPLYYHGFGVAVLNLETFTKVLIV